MLFDSPPSLSVSDPAIIASHIDVGILVVRAGKTPRQSVRIAADKFRHGRGKMGIVLNDLDTDRQGSSYYGYQYHGSYSEDPGPDEASAGGSGA